MTAIIAFIDNTLLLFFIAREVKWEYDKWKHKREVKRAEAIMRVQR